MALHRLKISFGTCLLVVLVFETSIGGGGRLVDTGIISLRMVLFGAGVGYSVVMFLRSVQIPKEFGVLTVLFSTLCSTSMFISMLENLPIKIASYDLKPLLFFLLMPFFAMTIRRFEDVIWISNIWKLSAIILAVSYLVLMAIWKSGLLTTDQMIGWLNPKHDPNLEFYFRGKATFVFKALIYIGVGVFFFIADNKWYKKYAVPVLLLAIAVTMTRGIWLSVFIILSTWAFFECKNRLKRITLSFGLLLVGIFGAILINATLPSVEVSNAIRLNDMNTIANSIADHSFFTGKWYNVIFGHGLGAPILGRQAIEFTYANLFYKQGVIAIFFWLFPPIYLLWRMQNITDAILRSLAMPFLMSTALVYVASLFNPFLSNPIGMSVVMISMVAVRIISIINQNNSFSKHRPISDVSLILNRKG